MKFPYWNFAPAATAHNLLFITLKMVLVELARIANETLKPLEISP
jgi:hypothetical protein